MKKGLSKTQKEVLERIEAGWDLISFVSNTGKLQMKGLPDISVDARTMRNLLRRDLMKEIKMISPTQHLCAITDKGKALLVDAWQEKKELDIIYIQAMNKDGALGSYSLSELLAMGCGDRITRWFADEIKKRVIGLQENDEVHKEAVVKMLSVLRKLGVRVKSVGI